MLHTIHDVIVSSFETSNTTYTLVICGEECSDIEIEHHKEELGNRDVVYGLGGGKTLDTAMPLHTMLMSQS